MWIAEIATGEIGERPTAYTGMRPYGTTLRARRVLRRLADGGPDNSSNFDVLLNHPTR